MLDMYCLRIWLVICSKKCAFSSESACPVAQWCRLHLSDFPSSLEEPVKVFSRAVRLPLAIPVPAKCLVRLGLPTKKVSELSDCNGYLVLGSRLLNRWLVSIQACRRCCEISNSYEHLNLSVAGKQVLYEAIWRGDQLIVDAVSPCEKSFSG